MKYMLTGNYPFDPAAKTVDFTSVSGFDLKSLIAIVNQTAGVVIYSPVSPSAGGTLAGSVLTLAYDTTAMHSGDTLLVFYDEEIGGGKTLKDIWDELASTLAVSDTEARATLGAKTDAAASDSTSSWSLTALSKGILAVAQAMQIWWANRLGAKAAANSISVVNANDDPIVAATGAKADAAASDGTSSWSIVSLLKGLYALLSGQIMVRGQAAVGSSPSNYPIAVSGKDPSGNKQHVLVDASGNLYAKQLPLLTANISLSAAATGGQLAVVDGYNSWSVQFDTTTVSGQAFTFQYSPDNGTNWHSLVMYPQNASTSPSSTGNSVGTSWEGPIPRSATHVRVYLTAITSGSVAGKIIASPAPVSTPSLITTFSYSQASNSRVGYVSASKIRYVESSAALTTASPSFTGSWRDVFINTAGSTSASTSEFGKLVTFRCFGDNQFDIYVDESEDQTTNPRWLKASATATGSVYGATIQFSPTARYCRLYAVKTGSDLTYFRAFSKFEAA